MGSKTARKKTTKKSTKKKLTNPKDILKKPEKYMPEGTKSYDKEDTKTANLNKNKALVEAKIKGLVEEKGRHVIRTKEKLEDFPKGSIVSYLTKDGKFRYGGFLKTIKDEYFVLAAKHDNKYISFPVQFANIKKMFVGNPKFTVNDEVSLNTKKKPTKKPVKVGEHVIYYAKDGNDQKRFMQTKKYKTALWWWKEFGKEEEPEPVPKVDNSEEELFQRFIVWLNNWIEKQE